MKKEMNSIDVYKTMNKRTIFLHIGLPKTGTCTLQRHVFSKLKVYRNVGKVIDGYEELATITYIDEFISGIYYASDEYLDTVFQQFIAGMEECEKDRYGNIDENIPLLLSHEGFTTILFKVQYLGSPGFVSVDLRRLLERLKAFERRYNFKLRLMVGLRDVKPFLHSVYAQIYYLLYDNKHIGTLNGYLGKIAETVGRDSFGVSWLFNDKLKTATLEYFSADDVLFYKLEDLFSSDEYFQKTLSPFFGETLPPFKTDTVENKRSREGGVKVGSIKPGWLGSSGFIYSLKKAYQCFLFHYKTPSQLENKIVWDEESDHIFEQIKEYFKER